MGYSGNTEQGHLFPNKWTSTWRTWGLEWHRSARERSSGASMIYTASMLRYFCFLLLAMGTSYETKICTRQEIFTLVPSCGKLMERGTFESLFAARCQGADLLGLSRDLWWGHAAGYCTRTKAMAPVLHKGCCWLTCERGPAMKTWRCSLH